MVFWYMKPTKQDPLGGPNGLFGELLVFLKEKSALSCFFHHLGENDNGSTKGTSKRKGKIDQNP